MLNTMANGARQAGHGQLHRARSLDSIEPARTVVVVGSEVDEEGGVVGFYRILYSEYTVGR